jgi:ketosteroid isomerase-like protein
LEVAVSSQKVEVVRTMLEGVNGWDVDAMISGIQPDYEFVPIMATLEGRVYQGAEGVRQWVADMQDHWEYFECCPQEYYDLGDRVVALGHWRARGRVSGVEVEGQEATWVAWFRDDRMSRWRTFTDREEALKTAEVTEQQLRELPSYI